MIGPTWLAAILGVVMIVAAIAAMIRIITAVRTRKATDYEVDAHNVVMGVAMAGMLIPGLLIVTPGASTTAWIVAWGVITAWFAVSVVRGATRQRSEGRFTGHHLPHLVMSAAMIYMLAATGVGAPAAESASGMSEMGSAATVPAPTLDYAFVIFMLGYAVLVIDRLPVIGAVGGSELRLVGHPATAAPQRPLAPRAAAATNIVMAITMSYMLTMMFV